jgi:hypothetical protein
MTSHFESTITETDTRNAALNATRQRAGTRPKSAPPKEQIRTQLIASCGWPTDAPAPARKQAAKR